MQYNFPFLLSIYRHELYYCCYCLPPIIAYLFDALPGVGEYGLEHDAVLVDEAAVLVVLLRVLAQLHKILNTGAYTVHFDPFFEFIAKQMRFTPFKITSFPFPCPISNYFNQPRS